MRPLNATSSDVVAGGSVGTNTGTTKGTIALQGHWMVFLTVSSTLAGKVLEIGVVAGLLGRDATSGIVHQHHFQKVKTCVVEVVAQGLAVIANPLGERGLKVGIRGHAGPNIFGGGTEQARIVSQSSSSSVAQQHNLPEDLEDLVNLRITREQRLARAHLGKDAAYRPHVDTSGILAATKQNFRSAVPKSDNLVGVGAQRNTKGAGQTEISKLQVTVAVNQQVLRLEIAVQDAVTVAVTNTLAQLAHELLDNRIAQSQTVELSTCALGQSLPLASITSGQRLHVLLQVEIEELKNEVELVAVSVHNVEQAHNVGVAHLLEQRDLADGGRRDTLIFGFETDLLQGHYAPAVVQVTSLVDDTVCSCVSDGC